MIGGSASLRLSLAMVTLAVCEWIDVLVQDLFEQLLTAERGGAGSLEGFE